MKILRSVLASLAIVIIGGVLTVVIQNIAGVSVEGSFWGRVAYVATHCAYGILVYKTARFFS